MVCFDVTREGGLVRVNDLENVFAPLCSSRKEDSRRSMPLLSSCKIRQRHWMFHVLSVALVYHEKQKGFSMAMDHTSRLILLVAASASVFPIHRSRYFRLCFQNPFH